MTGRSFLCIIGAVLAMSAAGCAGSDPIQATLRADAQLGSEVEVSYRVDGERVTEVVAVPWELDIELNGSFNADLDVKNLAENGLVSCSIEMGASSPRATGEAEATCNVSGTNSGGTLTTSSFASGTEREGPDVLDADAGITLAVATVNLEGKPSEPAQFERFLVQLTIEGLPEEGVFTVSTDLVYDDGDTERTLDNWQRFDESDIDDDGVFRLLLPNSGGYTAATVGTHAVRLSGELVIGDGDALPYSERVSFDVEENEISVEKGVVFADGLVRFDLPSNWEVVDDRPVRTVEEAVSVGVEPLDSGDLSPSAAIQRRDSQVDFGIFRMSRPLSLGSQDDVLEQIVQFFGGPDQTTDPQPSEVGGLEGFSFAGRSDVVFEVDVLFAGAEVLVVQARAESQEALGDAQAIRDTLVLDPSVIPPLAHYSVVSFWAQDDRSSRVTFNVPANWDWSENDDGELVMSGPSETADVAATNVIGATLDEELEYVLSFFDPAVVEVDRGEHPSGFPWATVVVPSDNGIEEAISLIEFPTKVSLVHLRDPADPANTALLKAIWDTLTFSPVDPNS